MKAKVYAPNGDLIFDGTQRASGAYRLICYCENDYTIEPLGESTGIDYWQVTKENISATDDGAGNVTLIMG